MPTKLVIDKKRESSDSIIHEEHLLSDGDMASFEWSTESSAAKSFFKIKVSPDGAEIDLSSQLLNLIADRLLLQGIEQAILNSKEFSIQVNRALLNAVKSIFLQAGDDISADAKGKIKLSAGDEISLFAIRDIVLNAINTTIKSTVKTTIQSPMIELNTGTDIRPIARVGDSIITTKGDSGTILPGTSRVLAG